jgi:hypothetical protein
MSTRKVGAGYIALGTLLLLAAPASAENSGSARSIIRVPLQSIN